MTRITLLLFLIIFLLKPLKAQEYTVQNYTDENGLPQNSVKGIATDNAGFIWLATENGLVRFDGQRFSLFDKTKSNAKSNRMVSFNKNIANDQLYGLTEDWQLIPIKNGKLLAHPLPYQKVFNFANSTKETYTFTSGVPNVLGIFFSNLPYIIQKKNNYLYKIFNQSISLYHQNKLISVTPFNYSNQWRFFILNDELFYVDETLNITKFENNKAKNLKLTGSLANTKIRSANSLYWNISTNDVFISIENSLYTIKEGGKNSTIISKKVLKNIDFKHLGVRSIAMSKNNTDIYIGTSTRGLFVFKEKQFKTLNPKKSFPNNVFYAQIPFEGDAVLYSNGYFFDKNKASVTKYFNDTLSSRFSIARGKNKNIWTTNNKVVYQLSPDLKKIISTYNLHNLIYTIYIDNDDGVWLGAEKGIYELDKKSNKFIQKANLSKIDRVTFLKKANGTLWIGTNRGLFYYNFINKKLIAIKELSGKDIRSILIRNNEIWITTYGDGFYVFKNNKLVRLPNDKNNYLNTAHCILEDKNGFFWISTNKGLFKASIINLLVYAANQTNAVYYSYYDRSAGFNTNEFNGGCQPCGSILSDGDFTFPSMDGVTFFNPEKVIDNNPDQPIYIDKIILDNKELTSDKDELHIPNNFSRLNIHFTSPYFGNKENLSFEYKLANQNVWVQSKDQIISFSSLPTGKNILNIRKSNGFGINNYEYKNISFIIAPHFYQTWWFIMAVCTLLFLGIYFYIKLRTSIISARNLNLEKRIDESTLDLKNIIKAYELSKNRLDHQTYFQNRLIGAITHDIKSPLKYLMMTGEALYKNESKAVDKEGIKAIVDSSTQIYHFTDNLIQYAKGFTNEDLNTKHIFNFYKLVEEKIAIFKPIAKTQNTTIKNNIDKEVLIKTNKHLLSVILHNLLDNAVKFTYVGTITISYLKVESGFKLTIKDSGIGMNADQVSWCNNQKARLYETTNMANEQSTEGLGLIMVKELNKIIEGVLYVYAVEGEGTTFELTLSD